MRKGHLLSEDLGVFGFDDWDGAALTPALPASSAIAGGPALLDDPGDQYPLAANAAAAATNAGSAKPVATIAQLADYLVNGFWAYNNTVAHHWASNTVTFNISALNAAEQALALSALEAWHEVANVTFVQTSASANITFVDTGSMAAVTNAVWNSSGIMSSAIVDISSDWITTDGGAYDGKTGIDSYGYQTYIHEIGHALGLGHQGPYNGSASYSTDAIYADDTWQYSIMSYFAEDNYSGSSYRYVVTPQMADIYALDSIYGAATATRTGNTVYGFNSNAGAIFNFANYSQPPAFTIYDSGGSNTLDCSGYSLAQTIDLHPGAFSSIGGLVHNIGIATNTIIQTAIAGSGNDSLIANDYGCTLVGGAGNDTLIGGAGADRLVAGSGADTMTGAAGADTFVFAAGDVTAASGTHDLITDFVSGVDHIDLSGLGTFSFIGASAFDHTANELDYGYNSALGVTMLQGDINGDGTPDFAIDLTGNVALSVSDLLGATAVPLTIESFGSTTLSKVAGNYFLYASGTSSGPSIKYLGANIVSGQFGGWSPIGGEATSTGYDVAWKLAGADAYTVWATDANGNDTVQLVSAVSGSSAALESLETTFHQDLNGDGVIGIFSRTIESLGSTSLVQLANVYDLNPVGGGTGPTLKYQGVTITAGEFPGWSPIGAEATSTGYDVAWKLAGADAYTVWATDANGNDTVQLVSAVSGSSAALESLETTFHQDLNGDGVIGIFSRTIESLGSTSLVQLANVYDLNPVGGGTGPTLKYQGMTITAGEFPGWSPIGAEATSSGYDVAWKLAGADAYTVWATDTNGNDTVQLVSSVPGNSTALQALETTFHQDLNGDGVIGIPSTTIESFGSTSLVQYGNVYDLNPVGGGTGPTLKYQGAAITVGAFPGWSPIGAEATSSGYDVAWKLAGADAYTVWATDTNGNDTVQLVSSVPGSSTALESLETTFHQDLNGDGTIGIPVSQSGLDSIRSFASTISADGNVGGHQNSFLFRAVPGATEVTTTINADLPELSNSISKASPPGVLSEIADVHLPVDHGANVPFDPGHMTVAELKMADLHWNATLIH